MLKPTSIQRGYSVLFNDTTPERLEWRQQLTVLATRELAREFRQGFPEGDVEESTLDGALEYCDRWPDCKFSKQIRELLAY